MAIQSSFYLVDGSTRTFPSTKHIATKQHCAIYLKSSTLLTWSIVNTDNYMLINNSIVFDVAPSSTLHSDIEIRVADTQGELIGLTSDISLVAGSISNVNINATNIDSINTNATNIISIGSVSSNIIPINTVANNLGNINTISSISNDVHTVAQITPAISSVALIGSDVSLVASTVSPNIAEILLADNNATIASNSADSATISSISANNAKFLAEKWSSEAENVAVTTGKYSSYHWAQKSLASASEHRTKTVSYSSNDLALLNSDSSLFVGITGADWTTSKSGIMTAADAKKLYFTDYYSSTRDANYYYFKSYNSVTDTYVQKIRFEPVGFGSAGILTNEQYNTLSAKQDALVSATNIKTINGSSILGSGNLTVTSAIPTIDALSNVVITANSDNEVLAWDTATSKWINQTATEAGLSESSHTHAGVYEPADATILKSASIGTTVQAYNANTTTAGNTFNGASQLVQLNATGQLPAIDGSLLTGITGGATTLDGLSDVVITTPSTGQVVKYNGTNWINDTDATGGGSSTLTIQDKTTAYTVVAGDLGTIINCTSGTFTVSLTAAATLGAGFNCWVWNTSSIDTDVITIDPNGAETIDGIATVILRRGEGTQIVSDGTNWQLGAQKELRGYADNIHPTSAKPIATGNSAVAIHVSATASGANCIALGRSSTSSGSYSFSTSLSTASSTNSTAIGINSGSAGSQAVTGAGAMALGGSYASGTDSFAAAIANNTSSYGATGANSVAIGETCKSSGGYSVSLGRANISSGLYSLTLGRACQATATFGFAFGYQALSNISCKTAYGFGNFGLGASQNGKLGLVVSTTDNTPSLLTSDGSAATSSNQLMLQNNSAYTFTGTIISKQSGSTNVASWKIEGVIVRGTTAGSTVLVASTVTAISNVPAWTLALSADTTNGGLAVTFTGATATNIRTVCTIETSEVIYA